MVISALITPSGTLHLPLPQPLTGLVGVRFMLLHDQRSSEEAVRSFMESVQELYVKALLNPFHDPDATMQSLGFSARVRKLAQKYWSI